MKEIDHNPNEPKRRNFPDYDSDWVRKEYGDNATPGDLARWLVPIAIVMTALFLAREGWPF